MEPTMPTYEYVCGACSHEFEEFQSITARVMRKCPVCGKAKLKRLIGTGAGVIFKGSGFYETDYRSESYKKDAKADAEAAKPKSNDKKKSDKSGSTAKSKEAKSESKASGSSAKKGGENKGSSQ
jgi:putative FmdB family regulatory protein